MAPVSDRSARIKRLIRRRARACDFAGEAESAAIILADPARYDGLPLIWARMWAGRRRLKVNNRGVPVDFDGQYKAMATALAGAGWLSDWRRDDTGGLRLYWRKPDTAQWRVTGEAYRAMLDEQPQGFLFRDTA